MKITVISKPEEKTSKKGTKYWTLKASDAELNEKTGSFFGDAAPEINQEYEVEEKYNDEYKSYSWFIKREKKGGFSSKPSLSVDQQIRVAALGEAVRMSAGKAVDSKGVVEVAKYFETYIR